MPWPVVTRDDAGNASFNLNGVTVALGPLASLDGDKTAILLRGIIELLWEATATPPNAARVGQLRGILGQLRGML